MGRMRTIFSPFIRTPQAKSAIRHNHHRKGRWFSSFFFFSFTPFLSLSLSDIFIPLSVPLQPTKSPRNQAPPFNNEQFALHFPVFCVPLWPCAKENHPDGKKAYDPKASTLINTSKSIHMNTHICLQRYKFLIKIIIVIIYNN